MFSSFAVTAVFRRREMGKMILSQCFKKCLVFIMTSSAICKVGTLGHPPTWLKVNKIMNKWRLLVSCDTSTDFGDFCPQAYVDGWDWREIWTDCWWDRLPSSSWMLSVWVASHALWYRDGQRDVKRKSDFLLVEGKGSL